MIEQYYKFENKGWVCPNCGRGCAPTSSFCCRPSTILTSGTDGAKKNIFSYESGINHSFADAGKDNKKGEENLKDSEPCTFFYRCEDGEFLWVDTYKEGFEQTRYEENGSQFIKNVVTKIYIKSHKGQL